VRVRGLKSGHLFEDRLVPCRTPCGCVD